MTDQEKTPYHRIMVDAWRIFIREREVPRFSDKWWEEIIKDYDELREPYKRTDLDDYVCDIAMLFLNEYERVNKHERQKRVSKELLSEDQRTTQTELQLSDNVCKVGRLEEVIEPFT